MEPSSQQSLNNSQSEQPQASTSRLGVLGSLWFFLWDFLKVFLIALAIIIPVRFYLFQPFIVTGQSMQPTIKDGEYLIIDEISFRFSEPERGEVVVVRSPTDPAQFLIKRIIGLPGETVEIDNHKIVITNAEHPKGVSVQEEYISNTVVTFGSINVTLDSEEYFVLGDNRIASSDSRVFGPIRKSAIVGKVFLRAYPFQRFEMFGVPQYHM